MLVTLFLGILPHALPDTHHVAAGGIDKLAALASSCCRIETSVPKAGMMTMSPFFKSPMSASFSLPDRNFDAHRADLVVHFRVMDDLTEDINRLLGEYLARGIGQVRMARSTP